MSHLFWRVTKKLPKRWSNSVGGMSLSSLVSPCFTHHVYQVLRSDSVSRLVVVFFCWSTKSFPPPHHQVVAQVPHCAFVLYSCNTSIVFTYYLITNIWDLYCTVHVCTCICLTTLCRSCRRPFTSDVVKDSTVLTAVSEKWVSLITMMNVAAHHLVNGPQGTRAEAELFLLSLFDVIDMSLLGPREVNIWHRGVNSLVFFEHWFERNLYFCKDSNLEKDLLHLLQ